MPFIKDQYLDEITYRLSVVRVELASNNSLQRYNSNTSAEDFFCELLNIIYDWNLVNINNIIKNAPGIDLVDPEKQIAIQVSSQKKYEKIQDSLKKLVNYYPEMNDCHFYMLVTTTKQGKYSKPIETNGIHFDQKKDIWDVDDLLKEIKKLPINKLEQIFSFIEKVHGSLSIHKPGYGGNQIYMSECELEKNPYLFVSYCHQDRSKVYPILHAFKKYGIRYWYDDNLEPGVDYAEKIEEAIDYCQGAIIFLTENAVESEWCRKEIQDCVYEKKGNIIPVYIEQVKLKHGLRVLLNGIEYYDLSIQPTHPLKISQLVDILRKKMPTVFKDQISKKYDSESFSVHPLPASTVEQSPRKELLNIRGDFTFSLGKYPQSAKGKAITVDWKVIGYDPQKDCLTAISNLILDVQPYDYRKDCSGELKWENTTLYSWIHNELYYALFSDSEKELIQDITILSEKEANTFFTSNKSRKAAGSNYAIICKGLHTDDRFFDINGEYGQWWLRSDYTFDAKQRRVFCDGVIYPKGRKISRTDIGIRPAIKLSSALLSKERIAMLAVSPHQ